MNSNTNDAASADPIDVAIGARLRVLRKGLNMSQTELGRRLGVTFQQVQKYERGTNRLAGSTLLRAAQALGVHPGELFGEDQGSAPAAFDWSLLTNRGATELLQAFGRISSRQLRRAVIDVARTLASPDAPSAP